jgi:regulator of cell morphogenesis and NO signaling
MAHPSVWTAASPLATIALAGQTAVLDRFHLDFCCRGGRSLGEACRASNVDVGAVLEALRAEIPRDPAPRWGEAPLAALVDFIESTHHTFTRGALSHLGSLAARVLAKHGERHPRVGRVVSILEMLNEDLLPHLDKEERVLFPYVRALDDPSGLARAARWPFRQLALPLRVMTVEHERTGELLEALVVATDGFTPPAGACLSFRGLYAGLRALRDDLVRHVALENHVLFPRALALEASGAERAVAPLDARPERGQP